MLLPCFLLCPCLLPFSSSSFPLAQNYSPSSPVGHSLTQLSCSSLQQRFRVAIVVCFVALLIARLLFLALFSVQGLQLSKSGKSRGCESTELVVLEFPINGERKLRLDKGFTATICGQVRYEQTQHFIEPHSICLSMCCSLRFVFHAPPPSFVHPFLLFSQSHLSVSLLVGGFLPSCTSSLSFSR